MFGLTSKNTTTQPEKPAAAPKKKAFKPPQTPYVGMTKVDGKTVRAVSGPHTLVSGPSGVGKSRRVLAPACLMWRGPVVAVSSKPDLIGLCLKKRLSQGGRDKTFVLDLSGEVPDDKLPEGVHRVVVDPTALIHSDDDALDMATTLMKAGTAGAGGNGDDGSAFWESLSLAPLAAILRAAGKDGIGWAQAAISQVEPPDGPEDKTSPCWITAHRRLDGPSPVLAAKLAAASKREEKQRDSIGITMETALTPWLRSTVIGSGHELRFIPDMLADKCATLFVVAPADGAAAGAAVAVVEFITKRWRANQTEARKLPRVLLCVDELCNTMPWPKLPTVVTEARAMGVNLLVAVQATSQFARRYGDKGMTELREVFPSTLILVGAAEKDMLDDAAWWSGQTEKVKVSTDHLGKQSMSSEMADVMSAQDLLPKSIDEGRLIRGRKPREKGHKEAGLLVQLRDLSEMIPDYDDYVMPFFA